MQFLRPLAVSVAVCAAFVVAWATLPPFLRPGIAAVVALLIVVGAGASIGGLFGRAPPDAAHVRADEASPRRAWRRWMPDLGPFR